MPNILYDKVFNFCENYQASHTDSYIGKATKSNF